MSLQLEKRIEVLTRLGDFLSSPDESLKAVVKTAYFHNPWFTEENVALALEAIRSEFLNETKLRSWLNAYQIEEIPSPRTVGIVMAGNIPLVGFHDFLCTFIAGHRSLVKCSDKDKILFPFILDKLIEIEPGFRDYCILTDRLKDFQAVIATGSNNSSRYFEYYFGKYPHIIRKNRTSVAVLTGNESEDDLKDLGRDVFRFFGLGCRNVSKIFVPEDYEFGLLLESLGKYSGVILHNKYKNNFDYNLTLLILNKIPYLSNESILIHENDSPYSRIASLHYEKYSGEGDLAEKVLRHREGIQCLVGHTVVAEFSPVAFGKAQEPSLADYADGVDTLQFLTSLHVN